MRNIMIESVQMYGIFLAARTFLLAFRVIMESLQEKSFILHTKNLYTNCKSIQILFVFHGSAGQKVSDATQNEYSVTLRACLFVPSFGI